MAADGNTSQRTSQVRIQLKTRDGEIELPLETGPILVSTDLKRYQLSTLVNRLLENERPIPLEFLINGQFLRTTLDDFLTSNGISAETTLNIEYVKALVPPLHVASFENDDWISSVDVLSLHSKAAELANVSSTFPSRILSSSFDGSLRVWDTSSHVIATGQWHRSRATTAKFLSPTQIVSAGADRSILLWSYTDSESPQKGTLTPKLELRGHTSSIEDIAVHATSSRILSASTDNRIGLWSTKKSEGPPAPETSTVTATTTNKRRKLTSSTPDIPQRGPLALLSGHRDFVNALTFDTADPTVAYSASQDHTVKTWDLPTCTSISTRQTSQSLTSILHLPSHSLIAAGGAERYINLIDPRENATKVNAMILRGHTAWVNAMAADPESENRFVSASNDGTCRIWDVRSGGRSEDGSGEKVGSSVFVIERSSQKGAKAASGDASRVFGVAWDKEVGILSGGRDKMLQINKSPS